jgi:hypothetical protein
MEEKEKLWEDVRKRVEDRIKRGDTRCETWVQKRTFWLKAVTDDCVRVKREGGNLPYEDIPKDDFIAIWEDLHNPEFAAPERGYKQKDLHEGQNRRCALSFALVGMLPYIEWRQVGRAWVLLLKRS